MKTEVKEKWVAALRSGDYTQGRLRLRTPEGYCCLGVLCDLYAKEHEGAHWEGYVTDTDVNAFKFVTEAGGVDSVILPDEVMVWAGLDNRNPDVPDPDKPGESVFDQHGLASFNDGEGREVRRRDFAQIAKLIEDNL